MVQVNYHVHLSLTIRLFCKLLIYKKTLTLESEDTPSGFTLILTVPLGETLNWLLETAAFWAAGFVGLSSSSALPVTYRNTPLVTATFKYCKLFSFQQT